jgi:putative redox protein
MTYVGAASPNGGVANTPRPPARVTLAWQGEHELEGGRPGRPAMRLDGSGQTGPSPIDALLSALGGCASIDVIEILAKRRTPVRALSVDVTAERASTVPARLTRVLLTFTIAGESLEREHVERAIELSITKYCSVRDSLREDIPVEWALLLQP